MKRFLINLYYTLCRIIFGYQNAVVFVSFSGKSYSDNPRPVSEKLHELSPKTKIVWFFKNPEEKKKIVPPYVICVDATNKLAVNRWLATAKCVLNNGTLIDCKKGKKQFFVQLWHGDRGFKKVLYDSSFVPETFKIAEERPGFCDLAVAGSKYGEMQFRSAFRYPGEILTVGIPRNDVLIKNDAAQAAAIKESLGISKSKKVLLYAPTLRRENATRKTLQEKQAIDLEKTLQTLEEKTGSDWVLLVRAHPATPGLNVKTDNERIIDASAYEDAADLLLISDFLITDYSSSAGDFALLRRPIILFQSDRQEYLDKDRTFYFDIKDSPFFVAETQAELEELIQSISAEEYAKNCDDILNFYETVETGKASEAVAKRLIQFMEKGERNA